MIDKKKLKQEIIKSSYICMNKTSHAFLYSDGTIKCSNSNIPPVTNLNVKLIKDVTEHLNYINTNDELVEIFFNMINKTNYSKKQEKEMQYQYPILSSKIICNTLNIKVMPIDKDYEYFKRISNDSKQSYAYTCISKWFKSKIIYDFDKDFLDDIINSNELKNFNQDIFFKMPYNNFYCIGRVKNSQIEGFIINFDKNSNSLIFVVYNNVKNSDTVTSEAYYFPNVDYSKPLSTLPTFLHNCLKQVLYLCTYNPEIIVSNSNKKESIHKSLNTKNFTSYDVGYKLGNTLRQYKKIKLEHESSKNKSKKKMPHYRRGHFHKYWIGHKDSQEQIIKWVESVIVNKDLEINDNPIVHKVK